MYITITEIDLSVKLRLEGFLKSCGKDFHVRKGDCGYDVMFGTSGLLLLAASDDVVLVDDKPLHSITLDRNVFLEIKIQ